MGHTESPEATFADWLRRELDQRGWGIRTLAKKIDPENSEVPRRALNRYMRGARPTEQYAQAIAAALELDRSEVPTEEAAPSGDTFRGGSRGGASRVGRGTETAADAVEDERDGVAA